MNFIELIGKNFDRLKWKSTDYSLETEEDEEEGVAPYWTVTAHDGTFAMSLNQQKVIETIWLYPVKGKFNLQNYTTQTTRKQIRQEHGKPTATGEVEASFLQEVAISWDRYDTKETSLHFEFSSEDSNLRLITIMDSQIVP